MSFGRPRSAFQPNRLAEISSPVFDAEKFSVLGGHFSTMSLAKDDFHGLYDRWGKRSGRLLQGAAIFNRSLDVFFYVHGIYAAVSRQPFLGWWGGKNGWKYRGRSNQVCWLSLTNPGQILMASQGDNSGDQSSQRCHGGDDYGNHYWSLLVGDAREFALE